MGLGSEFEVRVISFAFFEQFLRGRIQMRIRVQVLVRRKYQVRMRIPGKFQMIGDESAS